MTSLAASGTSLAAQLDTFADFDRLTAVQAAGMFNQMKFTASDAAAYDRFGRSVAVSDDGSTALVGAYEDDTDAGVDSGAVYVYDLSGSSPTETTKLTASDAAAYQNFGNSVAVSSDGTTALVGAYRTDTDAGFDLGAAYVYDLNGSSSTETKLTASDATPYDQFGNSVAVSDDGTTALVGAYRTDTDAGVDSGAAYVYDLSGSSPTETKLTASDATSYDIFGTSVSVSDDGTTALIGAPFNFDAFVGSGAVYVYDLSGSSPTETTKLTASDAVAHDNFGRSVSVSDDGTTALIGAPSNNFEGGFGSGSAYVYDLSGSSPTETTKLTGSDAASGDNFGWSVAVSGDGTAALVGALDNDGGSSNSGSAYVYDLSGSSLTETTKLTGSDAASGDNFGWSVAVSDDGTTVLVGTPGDSDAGRESGSAYVFTPVPMNQPPIASFSYDPATPEVCQEITFDATGSSDPDGMDTIASYEWDFGDTTTGNGQTTTHTYTAEHDYDVTLTVTDDAGATDTVTQTVEVVVFAEPLVVKKESYLPRDLDGDGLYEDIDGDGAVVNGKDTRALAHIINAHRKGELALCDAQVAALDFSGDGHLTGADNGAYNRTRKK